MIEVEDEVKKAYDESTTQIDKIILDGKEHRITNVQYDDDVYEEGNIFGTAIARTFEFEIENTIDLENKEFEYLTGIYVGNEIKWISLGNFITQEVEPNNTTNITKVIAMDYMLKTNIEYKPKLDYSKATLLDVALDSCNQCGLELATVDFANSNFRVDSNQFAEGTLNRQVIQAIAQISGTIAKIRNDNRLYFINPSDNLTASKEFSLSNYEEAEIKRATQPINAVSLGMSNIEGENITLRDNESIAQYGENNLVINDNPFAYTQEKREQLIIALFNAVKGFEYKAFSFKCQSLPYLETTDKIQFIDKEGNTYNSYIFRFNYKSPNGLESTIEAPSIIKATVAYQNVPSALDIAKKTEYKVDKQNQTITQLAEQQTDHEKRISRVTQDVSQLQVAISEVTDMSRDETGNNTLHITDTIEGNGYVLNFTVFGSTTNMHYLTPEEGLVPHDGLVPNGGFVTVVCDKKGRPKPSAEAYQYKIRLNEPLRDLGNVRDELSISNSGVVTVTRRLGTRNGVNGEVYELDQEVTETLEDIRIISPNGIEKSTNAILHTFEEETYVYIKEFYNLDYEIKYITQSDYSEQFVTKVDMEAYIKVTSQEILSVVKETYASQTELNNMEQTFESSISQTSKSILSTVSNTYATKTSLTDTKTTLETQISQTAEDITTTVSKTYATKNELTTAKSEIKQTTDSITTNINNTLKNYSTTTQMNSAITQKASEITTNISKTYATKSELTTAKSEIKQTTDSITTTVSRKVGSNEIISKINQSSESVTINASKLNLSGYITATNLKTAGSTVINGSNITTGTIDASKASITNINADNIKSGTITGRTISGGTISGAQITCGTSFKVTNDGKVTCSDININGGKIVLTDGTEDNANFEIRSSTNSNVSARITPDSLSVGSGSTYFNFSSGILTMLNKNSGVSILDGSSVANFFVKDLYVVKNGDTTVHATTFAHDSLESLKENIFKYEDCATNIVNKSEIYKYTFKNNSKEHIGFVIADQGGNYKTPKEVIIQDGTGIDVYSMSSILWKAMQEVIERVEKLEGVR